MSDLGCVLSFSSVLDKMYLVMHGISHILCCGICEPCFVFMESALYLQTAVFYSAFVIFIMLLHYKVKLKKLVSFLLYVLSALGTV
jgi:hypothetical protein